MSQFKDRKSLLSKVNAVPRGLQNLLGNVNQGKNPSDLNSVIQPSVDLLPFWILNRQKIQESNVTQALIPGSGITIRVPEGEIWMPLAVTYWFAANATGDECAVSVGVVDEGNTSFAAVSSASSINVVGTGRMRCSYAFNDGLILSGGWGLRGETDYSSTTTAAYSQLEIWYVPLGD